MTMATWRDISTDNEEAAKAMLHAGRFRSAVSRAYYAAYAAVIGRLVAAGTVSERGPSHKALPIMVEGNVPNLADWQRRDLKAATRRMYEARLHADYRASIQVGERTAFQCLTDLGRVLRLLHKEPTR
jgi:uncharacterized protein (UPF0332 family)